MREEKILIEIPKGTLKHSKNGYVTYNKEWLRNHLDTEFRLLSNCYIMESDHTIQSAYFENKTELGEFLINNSSKIKRIVSITENTNDLLIVYEVIN